MTLRPITPEDAKDLYLESRREELAVSTIRSQTYRLEKFVEWCRLNNITNLNSLDGRQLQAYKNWRRDDGDLNKVALKTQIDTIRVFIRFLESIDGVSQNLSEKVISPSVGEANRRDILLQSDRASEIMTHLSRYHYASQNHVLFALLWGLGGRLGTIRSFDVEDYDRDNEWLSANHRPESDTPLKNKQSGERLISLRPDFCQLLDDYIGDIRIDSEDDYGRNPLLTTEKGRISRNKIRADVYKMTCPKFLNGDGPCDPSKPHECPDSVSPHAVRRGSITHFLANDVPEEVVSDRMDVSRDVLDKHYDRRSEEVKVEQRRRFLENI